MKNSRGFAISTIMYMILILGLTIVAIVLAMLSVRGNILSKLRSNVQDEVNDTVEADYICVGINTDKSYSVGSKYKCSVSNTEEYDFYVLSSEADSVNLVLEEPLSFGTGDYDNDDTNDVEVDSKVAYITDTDYDTAGNYKPITALKVLKNATDNWFYLDSRTGSYDGVDYNNYKARLLAYSDITNDNIKYIGNTLTSTLYQDNKIYSVDGNEIKNDKTVSDKFNIIPVITVLKSKMKD